MSKYEFYRLGGEKFQQMVQALLESKRRAYGNLIQFTSSGQDGAREATWIQEPNHPDYARPVNANADTPKLWIFQVKFHDLGLRGWDAASAAVISDLNSELNKVALKYKYSCHHFVLITNVPLTGAWRVGTRDKVSKVISEWVHKIPQIDVWDAADLSRMLDSDPSVRSAYADLILPGDILTALYHKVTFEVARRESVFHGYLQHIVRNESKSRAEEAGDDDPLPLSKVYIDQTLQLDHNNSPDFYNELICTWNSSASQSIVPHDLDNVPASFPMLWGEHDKLMLAGPGYGKSTITQFVALYHACRINKSFIR